ncbi:MAG TPA: dephospho-CoA kinase [Gammaproteobacteria bacterium]|uniref:dephospho-CoA kinase n=1 Tax=Immundisolibacter sp. TaxID=1934948 RepID=UPI000E9F5CF6|nr:dephospho-CoA kinase [Gammaproteobacteria bacterium]HCZ48292.1 dephospho-CoA kinase [Gammaproteobacteria bacterium]MCH77730.1 dephospho-CoA kinase [Gammaproteobacteria bacterium]
MRPVVGLTGGVAAGKSTASAFFRARGIPVIDADQAARDVVQPGTVGLAEVAATFGTSVLHTDGSLNRRHLRERVFADPQQRRRLEQILHPLIEKRIREQLAQVVAPYCVLDCALLTEAPRLRALVQRVLVVDVPVETQLQRLMQRDGMTLDQGRAMLAAQASREQRLEGADDVVDNANDVDHLQHQLEILHAHYLDWARDR